MTDSGFSWPSMVPCCRAVATSGQAIGVGRMPIWRKAAMWMGFSVVRIFRPLASAGVLTGRTLLVRWRKPCSPQARAMMPRLGNLASMSWPILLSSTVRACGRSRSRKGISKTPVSGTKLRVACRNDRQVDGADLQPLDDLAFAAQRAVGELLHLVLAARRGFDGLGHGVRAGAVVRRGRQGVGHLQGVLRRGGRGSDRPAGGQDRGCKPGFAHCLLQYSICSCRGVAPQ